jgi:hypothetical protein
MSQDPENFDPSRDYSSAAWKSRGSPDTKNKNPEKTTTKGPKTGTSTGTAGTSGTSGTSKTAGTTTKTSTTGGKRVHSALTPHPKFFDTRPSSGPIDNWLPEDRTPVEKHKKCGHVNMSDWTPVDMMDLYDHRSRRIDFSAEDLDKELEATLRKSHQTLMWIASKTSQLCDAIERTLQTSIIFSLVHTENALHGYTRPGEIIFLNVHPLLESSQADALTIIYMTLTHELAHRVHSDHGSEFAEEHAKYVLLFSWWHQDQYIQLVSGKE